MKGDDFFRQVAKKEPFSELHPNVAAFFKDYLSHEKVTSFRDRFVVNTHFPPYPSPAFDNCAEHFDVIGEPGERHLYSVTLAVTNRCNYKCWHCYNAGRSQEDVPLNVLRKVAGEFQDMGAVMVTLTGGEPLLRDNLEAIVKSFDERSCLILGTTGAGLTQERVEALRANGLFAVGISLDSAQEDEHDRMRGVKGAFRTALEGLRQASENGLYPYVVSVATHDFLKRERFMAFMRFAAEAGALEVHIIEPSATGRLAGREDVLLTDAEEQLIFAYQREVAREDDLPILSSYSYLESSEVFGCGAGLTHLYIDGSGEVCPCNLVPLSFGNITREPLRCILDRMGCHFRKPRARCAGCTLAKHVSKGHLPAPPEVSAEICEKHLSQTHDLPRFFHIRAQAQGDVGREEIRAAYDNVHQDYDEFWLTEAAKPIEELVGKLHWGDSESVFEAGCGTGYATALIAGKLQRSAKLLAVDISEGMLAVARRRVQSKGLTNVRFLLGDAIEALETEGQFGVVFSSWVLGYIPLKPFFAAATRALSRQGQLAFVVHEENSPREPLEIFADMVAQDPSVMQKRVAFDFPRNMDYVRSEMKTAELDVKDLWEGSIVFRYETPEAVLEHLMKSGAATAFYEAVDPERRASLEEQFLGLLADRRKHSKAYEVIHDYVACIARKP